MSVTKQSSQSPLETLKTTLSRLISTPFDLVMNLIDIALTPIQRMLGVQRMGYVFVLPNLLIFGIFILLPMMLNFVYGFTSGSSILLENREYIGTDNIERILTCEDYGNPNTCREDIFWRAVRNTSVYVVIQVSSMVALALITALALKRQNCFQGIFPQCVFLSGVIVACGGGIYLALDS